MYQYTDKVERWGVFSVRADGRSDGNPFLDYTITGTFFGKNETKTVDGFYDGDGHYVVRFMPSFEGTYRFFISGTFSDNTVEGEFLSLPASGNNHGPVRVCNTYHFAYEDGTPYRPIGTTCYVWHLQDWDLQEQTLQSLKDSAFNKIRFCVFPKHYDYNLNEPYTYPYEGSPCSSDRLTPENFTEYNGRAEGNDWDYTRFNPAHFAHLERRIRDLCEMGVEADLIVMHPYDRWGFSMMTPQEDDLYWKYLIARISAYRNVWWSLANEYDLMPQKSIADWERYASILCERDAYNHLRSIHNCRYFYDHRRPWITHCSIQRTDPYLSGEKVTEWREQYGKPVVLDEIIYEGDIPLNWGNISGEELTRRFWEAAVRGGYPGHGETYLCPERILWWSHGGKLKGSSPERIRFLADILGSVPGAGLKQLTDRKLRGDLVGIIDEAIPQEIFFLVYYGRTCPRYKEYRFNDEVSYHVELIDTWNMTIQDLGICRGTIRAELPGREYMALRLTACEDSRQDIVKG